MIDCKAKALFLKYNGSIFFMAREGEYDAYKSFHIPRETEIGWIGELRVSILDQLATMPLAASQTSKLVLRYLSTISHTMDYSTVSTLIQTIAPRSEEYDSFLKLRCAEDLIRACEYLETNERVPTQAARQFAERLLQEVLDNPVSIADEWREEPHLPDTFSADTIKGRALKEYEKSRGA